MGRGKLNKKRFIFCLIIVFCIGLCVGAVDEKRNSIAAYYGEKVSALQDENKWICYPVMATALKAEGDPNRLVPIYRVATAEKKVAISFDAAWGADKTPQILEVLKKHKVKTTFFLVKFWAEKYPEMVKRIAAEGHEIGNHSATHPDLTKLSESQIVSELADTHKVLAKLSGQEPYLFRPPFGAYNNRVINGATKVKYLVIQWSVDSLDWKDLSANAIANRVLKQVKSGDIILFHNNGAHTVQAVDIILSNLEEQGYKVVPISKLVYKDNYYIDKATGEQRLK